MTPGGDATAPKRRRRRVHEARADGPTRGPISPSAKDTELHPGEQSGKDGACDDGARANKRLIAALRIVYTHGEAISSPGSGERGMLFAQHAVRR